jgi:hypothetical protein
MIMDRMMKKMEGLMKWRVGNRREVNMIAGKMKMKVGKKGRREIKMLLLPRSLGRKRLHKSRRWLSKLLCRKRQHKIQQLLP